METEPTPIFQCEVCLRYFRPETAALILMDPQPRPGFDKVGIPELCVCGRADCRAEPPPPIPVRRKATPKPDCRSSGNMASAAKRLRSAPSSASFVRGCPEDAHSNGDIVGSSQKEFLAAVDVKESERLLYECFVAHYLEWVSMVDLASIAKVHAVHSRIPAVREMIPSDHDIDQMTRKVGDKPHSFYRLCPKADSERLKRIAAREQDNTEEMI